MERWKPKKSTSLVICRHNTYNMNCISLPHVWWKRVCLSAYVAFLPPADQTQFNWFSYHMTRVFFLSQKQSQILLCAFINLCDFAKKNLLNIGRRFSILWRVFIFFSLCNSFVFFYFAVNFQNVCLFFVTLELKQNKMKYTHVFCCFDSLCPLYCWYFFLVSVCLHSFWFSLFA